MTAALIAPPIPPRARTGDGSRTDLGRHAVWRGRCPGRSVGPGDVVCGTGRIDESGRVADRGIPGHGGPLPLPD